MTIKPLTSTNIEKHFKDCCGLDAETVSHTRISQLSDGAKSLLVFAAALYNCPHVLIIDEPTNFLSGQSLIAVANALKTFEGGVIVVTHDAEFSAHVSTETWSIQNGRLVVSGEGADWMSNQTEKIKEVGNLEVQTEYVDAKGNVTEIKQKKVLSKKDIKQKIKDITKKIKNGEELIDDDYDFAIENKLI